MDEDTGTRMEMHYALITIDGEEYRGIADDELDALDRAHATAPNEFFTNVTLCEVRMVKA